MNNNQNILVDPQAKRESSIIKLISAYMLTGIAVYAVIYVTLTSMLSLFGIIIFSSSDKFIIALFFSFIITVWVIVAINDDKNGIYTLIAVSRKMPVLICFCAIIYGVFSCCYK